MKEKEIIFITGGQRSGKSNFAQSMAEKLSAKPIYLAPARHWDEDFTKRIKRHQLDRTGAWRTIEEEKNIDSLKLEGETVVFDCVTLWLTNIFHDQSYNLDLSLAQAKNIWDKFSEQNFRLIVVTNEIGMGLHAPDKMSREFTDLQGWINQHIAASAHTAYAVLSGLALKIK